MTQKPSVAEADLHALVDNRIESGRRSDVLRRLAVSPADRARVEAWQAQNDLIRTAFEGVAREVLPAVLDIAPSPLRIILDVDPLIMEAPRSNLARRGAAILMAVLVAAAFGGSLLLLDLGKAGGIIEPALLGTIDAQMASRATQALGADTRQTRVSNPDDALPTTTIPDLSRAGFSLVSAESDLTVPASLVFRYQNPDAEQLVISVARSQGTARRAPTKVENTFSWHHDEKVFAIAGTMVPERLREIALALQDDPARE